MVGCSRSLLDSGHGRQKQQMVALISVSKEEQVAQQQAENTSV